jgi:transcriptional regulator with XRE-family HTH domain
MATDYKKEAGRRLREARRSKNLTLEELSARVGKLLSPSRLSNYEQGIRMIGVKEALALHSILGVQPSHLLCVDIEDGDMTQQETELLRNFRALPEKDRNDYARRIEVLALAYREPVPDERLAIEVRKRVRQRTKSVK